MKGTVVWFNEGKGVGSIKMDENQQEVSAHFSEVQRKGFRTLYAGERVSFQLEKINDNTFKAVQIELEK